MEHNIFSIPFKCTVRTQQPNQFQFHDTVQQRYQLFSEKHSVPLRNHQCHKIVEYPWMGNTGDVVQSPWLLAHLVHKSSSSLFSLKKDTKSQCYTSMLYRAVLHSAGTGWYQYCTLRKDWHDSFFSNDENNFLKCVFILSYVGTVRCNMLVPVCTLSIFSAVINFSLIRTYILSAVIYYLILRAILIGGATSSKIGRFITSLYCIKY